MLNQNSIYVILFSLPIYQLLFYTVQLITFKKTSPSKRYFGYLMLAMTAFLIMNAVYHLGYDKLFARLFPVFIPVLLTIAPVFFLYILSLTREDHDVSKNQKLVFFIPPVLIFLLNVLIYSTLPFASQLTFIHNGFQAPPSDPAGIKAAALIFRIGSLTFLAAQMLLAGYKLRGILFSEAQLMRQRPAYLAYLNWSWIVIISLSVGIFLIMNGLVDIITPNGNLAAAVLYNVLMLICGGIAGYYGMKQNTLLIQVSKMDMPEAETAKMQDQESQVVKETEPRPVDFIQAEEAERIRLELIQLMETTKPFLKPDFSMADLCAALSESRRKITYVINDYMDKNFYGIVNDYRIREAIELLSQNKYNHLKIEVIAEMVGFQSKSSFNACFKKYTGQTPSAFKMTISLQKQGQGRD